VSSPASLVVTKSMSKVGELEVLTGTAGKHAITSKYVLLGTVGTGNFGKVRASNRTESNSWLRLSLGKLL